MHVAVGALAERFERASGHAVACDFGTVGGLQAKLDAGETADVLILSVPMIDKLEKAHALVPGSRADVARTYVAVCVREGAPQPDIGTPEAFERTLRGARAIAFSAAGVGGSAGIYLAGLFERMGLTAMMAEKGLPQQTGAEVARRVVEGTAEIGLTLSGEIASVPGAVIVGPAAAADRQRHDLLRGRVGGKRSEGCGAGVRHGADQVRDARDVADGGVRVAVVRQGVARALPRIRTPSPGGGGRRASNIVRRETGWGERKCGQGGVN